MHIITKHLPVLISNRRILQIIYTSFTFAYHRCVTQTAAVSLCLCSWPTGRSSGVRADLSAVPRGRGVCHGKCGILPRGAGTRWQVERGQKQNESGSRRWLRQTDGMNLITSVCWHRRPQEIIYVSPSVAWKASCCFNGAKGANISKGFKRCEVEWGNTVFLCIKSLKRSNRN